MAERVVEVRLSGQAAAHVRAIGPRERLSPEAVRLTLRSMLGPEDAVLCETRLRTEGTAAIPRLARGISLKTVWTEARAEALLRAFLRGLPRS